MSHPDPIKAWHLVFSGFLQSEAEPNGMLRLWRRLHELHASPDTCVLPFKWNADTESIAEFIWRLSTSHQPPRICVYGYSWGGAAAVRFCRALAKRDSALKIRHLILSDAIYRHSYWLGNWRALLPWLGSLRVPANVEEVTWFRQRQNRPAGHMIQAADPEKTIVHPPTDIRVVHQYMDDARLFHITAEHCSFPDEAIAPRQI